MPHTRCCHASASTATALHPEAAAAEAAAEFAGAWQLPVVTFGQQLRGPRVVPEGLTYCPDFISPEEEAELLRTVDGDGSAWKRHIRRAQQFFGVVYYQTSQAVPELQPTVDSPLCAQSGRPLAELPEWFLPRLHATGVFGGAEVNQVQGNEYLEDSGIGLHVEDPAAGETLATVSLLEPVQLTLQRAVDGRPMHRDERDREDCMKILLEPRSLFILKGESRHAFAHAIRQSKLVTLRDGSKLRRGQSFRRVSLTCRVIEKDRRTSARQDTPEGYIPYEVRGPAGGGSGAG